LFILKSNIRERGSFWRDLYVVIFKFIFKSQGNGSVHEINMQNIYIANWKTNIRKLQKSTKLLVTYFFVPSINKTARRIKEKNFHSQIQKFFHSIESHRKKRRKINKFSWVRTWDLYLQWLNLLLFIHIARWK